jgi:hypothetical protein
MFSSVLCIATVTTNAMIVNPLISVGFTNEVDCKQMILMKKNWSEENVPQNTLMGKQTEQNMGKSTLNLNADSAATFLNGFDMEILTIESHVIVEGKIKMAMCALAQTNEI